MRVIREIDFDVKRVIKETIESANGNACKAVDLDSLQRKLRVMLNGKRYLIVLDDVWGEDPGKWDALKYSLACGSKGASVIITTRIKKVASIMGTISPHRLSFLSDEDCWLLFKQRAFGRGNEELPNLVAIGNEIMKKCGCVPLAAKALGGLMRFKSQEKEWLHGSEIRKRDLIHLWMANDYISCKGGCEPEDIGDQIWNELCLISFFQDVEKDEGQMWCKMHDLVHDLAQSIMNDECAMIEFNSSSNISNEKVRHVTLVVRPWDNFNITSHKVLSLRTLRLQSTPSLEYEEFLCDFRKFGSLRAFDTGARRMKELPSSIGNVKHLRYLNLSRAHIKQLLDSICSLLNLQTLILDDCQKLERLPQNMMYLGSLLHLYLLRCPLIDEMPPKIGQLTNLKTLNTFVVGKSTDCSLLAELNCLNLEGEIHIDHLERVSNPMDVKEANLVGKQNLSQLELYWGYDWAENVESKLVLEALQPHPNLKELGLTSYEVGYIENEYLSGGGFPSLEELYVYSCLKLEGLSREEGRELFPCLRKIQIRDCPKLSFLHLSSSKELFLQGKCTMVLNSISNLNSLISLTIRHDEETVCFPKEFLRNLTLLESLSIQNCQKLKVLPEDLASLVTLKALEIEGCRNLQSLPEEGLRCLESL
ncbi:hypothetical protein ACSBR2_037345 [Camellia fascicularis]